MMKIRNINHQWPVHYKTLRTKRELCKGTNLRDAMCGALIL